MGGAGQDHPNICSEVIGCEGYIVMDNFQVITQPVMCVGV